jgi:hypothetical protein
VTNAGPVGFGGGAGAGSGPSVAAGGAGAGLGRGTDGGRDPVDSPELGVGAGTTGFAAAGGSGVAGGGGAGGGAGVAGGDGVAGWLTAAPGSDAPASPASASSRPTGSPHELQNLASAGSSEAQVGHASTLDKDAGAGRLMSCPHEPQAAEPGGTGEPQDGQ